jgi:phosphoribosylformylglycinamidine synthase
MLGGLIACCQGCYDAAVFYSTPFISGKDSLNNEYFGKDGQRHAIPPTLLISSIGIMDDLSKTVTMDLKQPGSRLYLAGDFAPALGGSHFELVSGMKASGSVPGLPEHAPQVYAQVHEAIRSGLVRACHDLSEGGLAVAAAEMCIGGRFGLSLDLDTADPVLTLFGETNGCLLLEVALEHTERVEANFAALPLRRMGIVTAVPVLSILGRGQALIHAPVDDLVAAWNTEN